MSVTTTRAPTSKAALLGLIVLIAYIVIASGVTTQWLAAKFAYQAALGERGAFGLYSPFAWMDWTWRFYRSAPAVFGQAWIGFAIAASAGALAYVLSVGFGLRSLKKHDGIHGTAHWADEGEIRNSGLLPPDGQPGAGVYCGAVRDKRGRLRYLRHNGPEHVAAIAPTRSGKGVGLVVPTLLSWPHSMVVNDQKGELWAMTAGWRRVQAGNVVLKFDPAAEHGSVAFNPLEEVRVGTAHEVGDVQNLVTIIVDPEGKGMSDHWSKTAHAFLTGLILHLQYTARAEGRVATLPDVAAALSDPERPVMDLYEQMRTNTHLAVRDAAGNVVRHETHITVASAARDMLNRAEAERSSVLSTAMSYLSLYRDPLVARNVSRSDFKISDLMNHVRELIDPATGVVTTTPVPVSLYLVVRAEDKDRMRPLMRLIINQIIRVLLRPELEYVEGRAKPPHLTRLLMMLDEFPSYGRLEVFQEALAYIAGYGIKAYLIMQDISQLQAAYGRDESIISNCHIRIAYAPNRQETGEWLSKNSGQTTVVTERLTTSGKRFGAFLGQVSRTYSETSRALITLDEAMRLKTAEKDGEGNIIVAGEMLVFVAGHAPIKGEQSLYFLNPTFNDRVKIAPPVVSDSLAEASPPPPLPPAPSGGFAAFQAKAEAVASAAPTPLALAAPVGPGRTRRAKVHRELAALASGDPELPFDAVDAQEAIEAEDEGHEPEPVGA